jgi:hypothetical protein
MSSILLGGRREILGWIAILTAVVGVLPRANATDQEQIGRRTLQSLNVNFRTRLDPHPSDDASKQSDVNDLRRAIEESSKQSDVNDLRRAIEESSKQSDVNDLRRAIEESSKQSDVNDLRRTIEAR